MQSIVPRILELITNWIVLLLLGFLTSTDPAQSANADFKEYEVKAVFLFNFAQFVEWPSDSFSDNESPVVICILGEDPFGQVLDQTVKNEKVQNRPIIIHRVKNSDEVNDCHILFVGKSEKNRFAQVLRRTESRNILTVSDTEGFIEQGGMVNFYLDRNKVRFEVNGEILKEGKLKISSQLLRLARIVNTSPNE